MKYATVSILAYVLLLIAFVISQGTIFSLRAQNAQLSAEVKTAISQTNEVLALNDECLNSLKSSNSRGTQ